MRRRPIHSQPSVGSICVGIHLHAEPERLFKTLSSLHQSTSLRFKLLLLGDGPDPASIRALREFAAIEQSSTADARGAAACFNRLIHHQPADVFVLLESGCQLSPDCLEKLVSALQRSPKHGLAGPSTNRAWNQQGVFRDASGSEEDVANTAVLAARRFGNCCRTLEPLYSLGDFCYAVRRQVVEKVGDADEGYGLGPCWEMDYNVRAHRAGFQGLWVCAAYAYRAPFTPRRKAQETALFAASKQRYQDKFCGLRLTGEKQDYREHCRGTACRYFAPPNLMLVAEPDTPPPCVATQVPIVASRQPLVSCIMPTYNRRFFLPRSLRCFVQQDYPNLELIIVDDGTESIADLLNQDSRIRHFRLDTKLTVGAKRNFACKEARGEIIAHWDDDDWYPCDRISRQVQALQATNAEVCGSSTQHFYNQSSDQAFCYRCEGSGPAWMGVLMYRAGVWSRHPFESIQIAEDVKFLAGIPARLRMDLRDPALCVASIHDSNTSPKRTCGSFWHPECVDVVRAIVGQDLHIPSAEVNVGELISCIMPTRNRRTFLPLALACFQAQTWSNKELIVVDDGEDPVRDLLEGVPEARYIRLNTPNSIGAKRNLACEHARGEAIAHWDDDDWYGPDRLAQQFQPVRKGICDLTGLVNSYILQLPDGQCWHTSPELHRRMFVGDVHGGTLLFRRSLFQEGIRYPAVNLAEDASLIRRAMNSGKRVLRLDNPGLFIYVRHGHNTWKFESGRFIDAKAWNLVAPPANFSAETLESYRSASLASSACPRTHQMLDTGRDLEMNRGYS